MAINNSPLGMNARNFIYIRKYNFKRAKRLADSKIRSKRLFIKQDIPTTKLLAVFQKRSQVKEFNWDLPNYGFVVKPSRGYGGEGILVFKNWNGEEGETVGGEKYDKERLSSHLFDILEGSFSLQYLPDTAYIEELVIPSAFFKKLAPVGLPDIRIIVFKKIPVMAMMRLPTKESSGKANLHLGALGIGIGLRTGITLHGIYKNKSVEYIPESKTKVRGIKIPDWEEILRIAVRTQEVCGLGYAGVDIVIDKNKGPMVLEVNTRPGLSVQLANMASLRSRLERIEDLDVPTIDRGIELGRSLFAETGLDQVDISPQVLSVIENVTFTYNGHEKIVKAKLDTGALRTALDSKLVKELGLVPLEKEILVKSASGSGYRKSVKVSFTLNGKKINTIATIVDRSHLQYPLIVGRRDLKGFLINPLISADIDDEIDDMVIEE